MVVAMPEDSLSAMLGSIPLFSELEPAQRRQVAATSQVLALTRNEHVIRAGERPGGCYYILAGTIKLATASEDGCEKVMDILSPGTSFGEALVFLDCPSPVSAQAVEPSRILEVNREGILNAVAGSPRFALHMCEGLSHQLHQLMSEVQAYCLHTASERVIGFLASEAEVTSGSGRSVGITLRASKALVASKLGLTPETFSRVLHRLSVQGLIQVDGRHIQIQDIESISTRLVERPRLGRS